MRISYSSLEKFRICPLKYKFSEIDKLKEPSRKELVFGSYLHKVLKWFYQNDPHFPTLDQLIDYYYKHWPKESEGFRWTDEKEEADYFQEGLRILREYYIKNIPHQSVILDLETKFEVVLNGNSSQADDKHILTGRIDRIDKLPDGSLEIIDYKSNKKVASQAEVDKNLQLSLYATGVKNRWPKIDVEQMRLSLCFLKFNEKMETRRTSEDLDNAIQEVLDVVHQIEKSSFEPRPSVLCQYCGFRSICPVWRHLYEKKSKDLNEVDIEKKIDEFFELQQQKKEIEQKLRDLRSLIDVYASQRGLKRVFGKNGYFTKSVSNKISYNWEEVKKILQPLGKWEKVLEINQRKLQRILKELPPEARKELEKARIIEKEYKYLEANKKSIEEIKEILKD